MSIGIECSIMSARLLLLLAEFIGEFPKETRYISNPEHLIKMQYEFETSNLLL